MKRRPIIKIRMVTANIRYEDGRLTGTTSLFINENGRTTTFHRDVDRLAGSNATVRDLILRELARAGSSGLLTGRLAMKVFGQGSPARRATTRCRTLARQGLVRRHESNDERWYITEAGQAAIEMRGRDG